jgi:nitrate/TMAO reductase-like tetraheme cytochrome c subunit
MKNSGIKLAIVFVFLYLTTSWMVTNTNVFYVPTTLDDFFLPGSQPSESGTFTTPDQCDNCHGNYDAGNIEPSNTWAGSMMAQSMRDPLFLASMTIANQDAQFAGDLCIRCHSPSGWLEGRSTPTDGSALTAADREGVQCHFCHRLIDPKSTDAQDLTYLNTISGHIPTVYGNGMFVVDSDENTRRGPFEISQAGHATLKSPFYTTSEYCATCHDVSNPVYTKAMDGTYQPNSLGTAAPSFDTYDMFPVERTYSEWKMSAYNSPGGIPSTVFGGNKANVSTCMDCHMADATGKGCDKNYAPVRNDMPLHDLTGGNTFVPLLIKGMPGVDDNAIDAGIIRAQYMLQNAATMNLEGSLAQNGYDIEVEIINETGHKLPSGYPEGRRMWINVQAYDDVNNLIYESGAYDPETGVLDIDGTKIYEAKLGMSQEVADIANSYGTGTYTAGESFHFALNNMVVKDNRIPPRGFTNTNFEAVQAAPVGYSYEDGDYSDETTYTVPEATHRIVVKLMYQTTSKEYIEFLRDKNVTNTIGQELYDLWVANGKSTPVVMNQSEFFTSSLGITNVELMTNTIKVYPNPASGTVHLKFENRIPKSLKVDLYTLNGVKIHSIFKEDKYQNQQIIDFDTSNLASGTYIIKLNIDGKSSSRLLVIK